MGNNRKSVWRVLGIRLLAAVLLVIGMSVRGSAVDSATATAFAENWLDAARTSFGESLGTLQPAQPLSDAAGTVLAYVFNLSPRGYLVLSADDRITPVIAVNGQGTFSMDAKSPAYAFLLANLSARLNIANTIAPDSRGAVAPDGVVANQKEWAEFAAPASRSNVKNVVSEIWVDSFVESKWSQGDGIYNYYTPTIYDTTYTFDNVGSEENLVCGCVATGTAQIMRYFQWPQKKLGTVTGSCTIVFRDPNLAEPDELTLTMKLRGGDGAGGAYKWDLMALDPNGGDVSEETKQQIGALCLDAGLSVGMTYNLENGNESGANYTYSTLMSLFGYANARALVSEEECRANLDARRPVAVSISKATGSGGHAIVCDGYGRMGGRWYYHMNMGWAGNYDGWYNFDENYYTGAIFTGFSFAVGNVFRQALQANETPDGGQIVSGRVVDANGNPVQGVKVSVRKKDQVEDNEFLTMLAWYDPIDSEKTSTTADWTGRSDRPDASAYRNCTDANGIWAIDKIGAGNYVVTLEKEGLEFQGDTAFTIGERNIWGKDFIAVPADEATDTNFTLQNWYKDSNNMIWLEFNRQLGNTVVDPGQIVVGNVPLDNAVVYQFADSNWLALDCSKITSIDDNAKLSIQSGALSIVTIEGETSSSANVAIAATKIAVTETEAPVSAVTAIKRPDTADFDTNADTITFVVTDGSAASLDDFKVVSLGAWGAYSQKEATEPPTATLVSYDGKNLTVKVGKGDGYVGVAYVPANGTPFITGEYYHVDNIGPAIVKAVLSEDNKYVDITWNEVICRDELSSASVSGIKASSTASYAYAGDLLTNRRNYAIWMCGPSKSETADGIYQPTDTRLSGKAKLATGDEYTGSLSTATLTATVQYGSYEIPMNNFIYGKYMFIDSNGDGNYTEGEGIFLKFIENLEEALKYDYSGGWVGEQANFLPCYDPDREGGYDSYFWISGPKPGSKTDAKLLSKSAPKVAYYNSTAAKPNFVLEGEKANNYMVSVDEVKKAMTDDYKTWLNSNTLFVDYAEPEPSSGYDSKRDTLIISEGAWDKATPQALGDDVYFLDTDGTGYMSSSSFIWVDDGDGVYSFGSPSVRDLVLTDNTQAFANKGPREEDFKVVLHANGGTVVSTSIYAITSTSVETRPKNDTEIADLRLQFGTKTIRVWLEYTPELGKDVDYLTAPSTSELNGLDADQQKSLKVPAGVETIEIQPAEDSVFDVLGNVAPTSNSTDEMLLYDSNLPRVIYANMRYDNMAVQLQFNKRIYGNSGGLLGNYTAGMSGQLKEWEVLTPDNFDIYVIYDDDSEVKLELPPNTAYYEEYSRPVTYVLGSAYCELNLFYTENNYALLNAQDGLWNNIDTITKTTTFDYSTQMFNTLVTVVHSADKPGDGETIIDYWDENGTSQEKRTYNKDNLVIKYEWGTNEVEQIEYNASNKPYEYKDGNGETKLTVEYTNGTITNYYDGAGKSVAQTTADGTVVTDSSGNAILKSSTDVYQPHTAYTGYQSTQGNVGSYTCQKPSANATQIIPKNLRVEFKSIFDLYGNALGQESVTIPLVPAYERGLSGATLPPPMFSRSAEPVYTHVFQRGDRGTISKELEAYPYKGEGAAVGMPWITAPTETTSGTTTTVTYTSSVRMANLLDPGIEVNNSPFKRTWNKITLQEGETEDEKVEYYGVQRIQYGVFYRDLDGDGRVDAVDLNFKNPYVEFDGSSPKYYAELVVNSTSGFHVYVQANDPNDYDNVEKQYYPAADEFEGGTEADPTLGWRTVFGEIVPNYGDTLVDATATDPLKSSSLYNNLKNFYAETYHKFSANWRQVGITSYEIKPSNRREYSTLRLHLNQSSIPPRTYGDRWVMVTYQAPRYSSKTGVVSTAVAETYNWLVTGGTAPVKKPEDTSKLLAAPYNMLTEAQTGYYSNADEESGIYWKVSSSYRSYYTNAARWSLIPAHFIVDSFGPVMAWDGAEPVPVAATTWRSQTYPASGESDTQNYEYTDVSFSESIAYAMDKPCNGYGYTDANTPTGYLYGAWGAELIDDTTVRFKRNASSASRSFSYYGRMAPKNGGFTAYKNCGDELKATPVRKNFSLTAVGIYPDSSARYRVLAHDAANSLVDVLTVDADGASINNTTVYDTTEFTDNNTFNSTMQYTTGILKAYGQGGGWTGNTAIWYRNGDKCKNTGTTYTDNPGATSTVVYSLLSNPSEITPGAGMYAGVSKVTVTNTTLKAHNDSSLEYVGPNNTTFEAPSPMGRFNSIGTALTPQKAVLAGPVYDMVKASATNFASSTTRIQAGETYDVIGIDCAASASHKLESVRVRFVDVSRGQFDPAIDLEPVADTNASGVQLIDSSKNVIKIATDNLEWSAWGKTAAGLPYRDVTLRLLSLQALPTVNGDANSFDFYIRIKLSENFNLGDDFYVEIPDDGITFNTGTTKNAIAETWSILNGTYGFPFTDSKYYDKNSDGRWDEGEAITNTEDPSCTLPIYDGGYPYFPKFATTNLLAKNGLTVRNLFYAKKEWATNPETYPFTAYANATVNDPAGVGNAMTGTDEDLDYNISYRPGDAIWYEIGGTYGVYDEGIDLPLFGNADKFILPFAVAESGARSEQLRAAAPAVTHPADSKYISAPSNEPVAVVGLNMQDSGKGFGPRYILDENFIVESISKNVAGGTYTLSYKWNGTQAQLAWKNVNGTVFGTYTDMPVKKGARAIIEGPDGTCLVIRNLTGYQPSEDTEIPFIVSQDIDRDIQQPTDIKGVRIHAVGRGNAANSSYTLRRYGTTLSWNDGTYVDVSAGGIFTLNPDGEDYIIIEATQIGGATSEALTVYEADGRNITPFLAISGLEIMAVSDMTPMGYYNFSYDGAGNFSWNSGAPVKIPATAGELFLAGGDSGVNGDFPRTYVVVRRTAGALPSQAVTERLFINQTQLLRVDVTLTNVYGITSTHFAPLTNDKDSGISLWWDANADGKFNSADMFVQLLETPVLKGSGNSYTCTLTPDPRFLTAWLSCPQDVSTSVNGSNFFVCVKTTVDMSYGDQFSVVASFYEPTEKDNGGVCFASRSSGTITCSSITNTVIKKLTTAGQTVDANSNVRLFSIDHFLSDSDKTYSEDVYITAVTVTLRGLNGVSAFDPETALRAMDDETAAKRGIVLYKYGKNGAADSLIECYIDITHKEDSDTWTYKLLPVATGGDSNVPANDDGEPDHFIAINMSDILPYGVAFNATMTNVAVEYKTGVGSAGSSVTTDTLTSTISTNYVDLLGSRMVTSMSGLVVNGYGKNVADGYHDISVSYKPASDVYTLTWNGNTVELDITQKGQYVLGTGDNAVTVTFDPAAFFLEDKPVNGIPPAGITRGAKLVNIIKDTTLTYFDADGNGAYTAGELIACNKNTIVYSGTSASPDAAKAVSAFAYSDHLAFYDEDGDGKWTQGEIIFHDTDETYLLPWMDFLLDNDNYVTAGKGGASSVTVGDKLVDASTISIAESAKAPYLGYYLYYVDVVEDGCGYDYETDVLVARYLHANAANPALTYGTGEDKVVLDPQYPYSDESPATVVDGKTLHQLTAMDYVRFRQQGADEAAQNTYEQGKTLFLSMDMEYNLPEFTWTIRIDSNRTVRRYEADAPTPFNRPASKDDTGHPTNDYALAAIIGLDIANGGASDVKLTSVKVRFNAVRGFTTSDLRPLANDITSGVQLWRDMDGNGSFDADIDKQVTLGGVPAWTSDTTDNYLVLSPASSNEISNETIDNVYDFFIVVQVDPTANSLQKYDYGDKCDQFKAYILNDDVILNKTRNSTAQIARSNAKVISIDSKPPLLLSKDLADTDNDGFIETISLVFDEKLRPGMLNDLDIWQITDMETSMVLPVIAAELSSDYMTVTLTLANSLFGSTSDAQMLKVTYNSENALMDWTGNPVDLRLAGESTDYVLADDTVSPRILHTDITYAASTEVYDEDHILSANNVLFYMDRNQNSAWDEGEDIWCGSKTYGNATQRVWNGGNAWTTPIDYANGKALAAVYFCDADKDGAWTRGEFIWIDVSVVPVEGGAAVTDGLYTEENDIRIPQNRTEEVEVQDRDGNGAIDTIKVTFSEYVKDETLDGYKADTDSYTPGAWTIADRTGLVAVRQLDDATNDNVIYFRFDEEAADTDKLPRLYLSSGDTLEDMNGNILEAGMGVGNIAMTDHAQPVLLAAVSTERITEGGVLPKDTVIRMTFSEPLVQYVENASVETLLAGFTFSSTGEGGKLTFTSDNATVALDEDNSNILVITVTKEITGLNYKDNTVSISCTVDNAFGDAAGNALHAIKDLEIPTLNSSDPLVFKYPVENSYIRNDTDALAVQIYFGDDDPSKVEITQWALSIYCGGKEITEKRLEGTDEAGLSAFAEGNTVVDFTGWATNAAYNCELRLTMRVNGRDKTYSCPFFYSQDDDVYTAGEGKYVFDGETAGIDVDQILLTDGKLAANWTDFAKAAGLPAAAKYVVRFYDSEDTDTAIITSNYITDTTYKYEKTLTINKTYFATVEAYDKNDILLARASSNGAKAVTVITDTTAPVIAFVNDGKDADIDVTASTTELSANWSAADDITTADKLQYAARIVTAFGAGNWAQDDATLQTTRVSFATAVMNGKPYVIGGMGGAALTALASMESYDVENRTWALEPKALNTARYNFGFAQLADDVWIVAGGLDEHGLMLDSIEVFKDGYWQTLVTQSNDSREAVEVTLPEPLEAPKLVAVDENRVWIIGGNCEDQTYSKNIYELNIGTMVLSATPIAKLSSAVAGFTALLQRRETGNVVVVAGGYDMNGELSSNIDVIDTDSVKGSYAVTQRALTNARYAHAAIAVPDGKDETDDIWFIGGEDNDGYPMASVEALTSAGSVVALANMNIARSGVCAVWLPNAERVLIAGGMATEEYAAEYPYAQTTNNASMTEYAARSCDEWTKGSSIAAAGRVDASMVVAGAAATSTRVVLFGGSTVAGTYLTTSESRAEMEVLTDWSEWLTGKNTYTFTGLNLLNGDQVAIEVKAMDEAGNVSDVVASDGVTINTNVVHASLTCANWPDADGGDSLNQDFTITVAGTDVTEYKYSLNGGDFSEWTAVSEPITLSNLADDDYTLKVCGKGDSKLQPDDDATIRTWNVVKPVIAIVSGLPNEGTSTVLNNATVTFTGNGVTTYDYTLYAASQGTTAWTETSFKGRDVPIATALVLKSLDVPKSYKLEVVGKYNGRTSDAVTRTWNVVSAGMNVTFSPEMAATAVARSYNFTATDASGLGIVDKFKYVLQTSAGQVVVDGGDTEYDAGATIDLYELDANSYKLGIKAHSVSAGAWATGYTYTEFTLVAATFNATELGPSTTDTYDVAVNLNGLAGYNYSIDDGSTVSGTDATIHVGPLAVGTHTLKLWGVDATGNTQGTPAELAIYVQNILPVGDAFTAEIRPATAEQKYVENTTVSFTVGFNDNIMGTFSKNMLAVTNGTIGDVLAVAGSTSGKVEYSVSVTPTAPTSAEVVALSLAANTVYSRTTGNGNNAATGSTVVFNDSLLAFTATAVDAADHVTGLSEVVVNKDFELQIKAQAASGFVGGDILVSFDSEYFTCTLPTTSEDKVDVTSIFDEDYRMGAFAEYVYATPGDKTSKIVGVRLGSTWSSTTATPGDDELFATLTFTPKTESTSAQAIATAASADPSGFILYDISSYILPADSSNVTYGNAQLTIAPEPEPTVTLQANKTSVTDGEGYTLGVVLSSAYESDVTVTLSDGAASETITIAAGQTGAAKAVTTATRDNMIKGHKTVTWTISEPQPSEHIKLGYPKSQTITIQDQDLLDMTNVTLTAVDAAGTTVSRVDEGDTFKFKVQLPSSITTSVKATYTMAWSGTAADADYSMEPASLEIAADGSSAEGTVTVTQNTVADNDKTLTLTLTQVTLDGIGTFELTGKSATVTLLDDDSDITFAASPAEVNEGGTSELTVSLGTGITAASNITFAYKLGENATAKANEDYTGVSGQLTIAAGKNSGTVKLTTLANENSTADHTFILELTSMTIGSGTAQALSNKSVTVTIKNAAARQGDLTGDNTVNFKDLSHFMGLIGSTKGDGIYEEAADFNGDGIINFKDLVILLSLMDTAPSSRNAMYAESRSGETFNFILTADKSELEEGDEFTLTISCESNVSAYQVGAAYVTVLYDTKKLAYNGAEGKTPKDGVNSKLNMEPQGDVSATGINSLGGSGYNTGLGTDGKAFVLATVPMKLTKASGNSVTISLADNGYDCSTQGGGFSTDSGKLAVTSTPLVIPVKASTSFSMALDVIPTNTRGTSEIQFGMKDGASDAYNAADGDALAWDMPADIYTTYFTLEGRAENLKWDYRGISDDCTWTVKYNVPAADGSLRFNWANYMTENDGFALPGTYYDIVLVNGDDEIDMRTATNKYIEVTGTGSFDIHVFKHIDYVSYTVDLVKGWNMVGIPVDLKEGEFDKFAGCEIRGFNSTTQAWVTSVTEMTAGSAYWVKAAAAASIELTGVMPEVTAVELKAGWNLVSPKWVENWAYTNPTAQYEGIADAWNWANGNYVCMGANQAITKGMGIWLYSSKAQTIWEAAAEEQPVVEFDAAKHEYLLALGFGAGYGLKMGMLTDASAAFDVAELDSPLPPLPDGCTVDVKLVFTDATGKPALSDGLVTDIRGVADDQVNWNIAYTVAAGKTYTLDWSNETLPAYYELAISVDGAESFIMSDEVKTVTLAGGTAGKTGTIAITCEKYIAKVPVEITLAKGWNIIGLPFDLTEKEFNKLSAYTMQCFDKAQQKMDTTVTLEDMTAGNGVWIYAAEAATITLQGVIPATTGVEVVAGWNLVGPKYDASTTTFQNPVQYDGIYQAWIWNAVTGYEWLREGDTVARGQAVWFHSAKAQTLWQ